MTQDRTGGMLSLAVFDKERRLTFVYIDRLESRGGNSWSGRSGGGRTQTERVASSAAGRALRGRLVTLTVACACLATPWRATFPLSRYRCVP